MSHKLVSLYIGDGEYYTRTDTDNVIADLEESHKMEVGQLLIEIEKLKEKRDAAEKLLNKALDCVSNGKNHMMSLARKKNHSDYKRCLAMAKLCHWKMGVFIYKEEKSNFYHRRHKRWLAIAEKFTKRT